MRTDRSRINTSTKLLLDIEGQLLQADQAGFKGAGLPELFRKIYSDIVNYRRIRTSREIDEFLQLSMIYIAARLHFDFRHVKESELKVSTSVYDSRHQFFVIKPSYFFPGSCSVRETTIVLTHDEEEKQPAEPRPGGLGGLALASGEILHCTQLQAKESCVHYVPLESNSSSALAIPLRMDLVGALDRFLGAKEPRSGPGPHCCECRETVHTSPRPTNSDPSFGVLNIDCSTGELEIQKAKQILGDRDIKAILHLMVDRLAGYQTDRAAYRVLRNCTALIDLSQHTLREARQVYVTLLREISAVCDGADVTLHLRDMFARKDRDLSAKIIAGFGPRFRGFLIGVRYNDGLVGKAMASGQFESLDRDEIKSAVAGKHPYSYRRLMPGTTLNAAFPILFHTRVIGAVNIEWDKSLVSAMNSTEAEDYLNAKQAALERLAQYFALVIDYFDDRENDSLKPPAHLAPLWVRKSTSRRRVLAYYVDSALQRIEAGGEEEERRKQTSRRLYLAYVLRDIIDAVGYFLTFESKHRILASVRYRGDGDNLDLVYAHGFNPQDGDELGPGGPIPIVAGQSVLGTCAKLGVAVFGQVENNKLLRPDRLCKEYAPEEDREVLQQPIHYKAAGHHPVYEVGVPLVFGGKILGTFDFELFSLARDAPRRGAPGEKGNSPPALAGHELAPFLEWARAITFCMAHAEDALDPDLALAKLGNQQRSAFHRFQRLCAQIVANVAIPRDLLIHVAGEYLRGVIPISELEFVPATIGAEPASSVPSPKPELASGDSRELELWWRGEQLGAIRMSLDAKSVPSPSVFPETNLATGTNILAQRFISAFYTAALSAERASEFDSSEFKSAISSVQSAFSEEVKALKSDELAQLDPYAVIETCFRLLHQALQRLLPARSGGSIGHHTGRHGWFLYMAQCIEDPDLGERAVLRSGRPFERWVSMSTQEMKTLVSQVLESQDPKRALAEILGPAVAEEILSAAPTAVELSVERVEEIFEEALGGPGRDYPDPRSDDPQRPSITAATVLGKRVRCDIDLNRSPVRSERKSKWFFGDKAYSIIGVPIRLGGRAIGVLQIFRRRDAIDDVLFFKNDEIQVVDQLGKMLEAAIAAQVECLPISVLTGSASEEIFTREMVALGDRLKERIAQRQVPLLVSCDFLAETSSLERFLNCYVGLERTTHTTHDLLKLETVALEDMDHLKNICVIYNEENPSNQLRERLVALSSAPAVILFVSRGDERTTYDLLPAHCYHERQETDDPKEVLRVAFGLAEGRESHDRKEIGILLRRSGLWTIDRLIEDCGREVGVIYNSAKITLRDLKERAHVSRRLFPDWYMNVDEAGVAPLRTRTVRRH